jgi:hypothetical protein
VKKNFLRLTAVFAFVLLLSASHARAASPDSGKLGIDEALNLISKAMPYEGEGEIQRHESKWESGVEFYRFEIHWYGDSATYYSILINSNTGAMESEEIEYDYAQAMRDHWEASEPPTGQVTLRDDNTGMTVELYPGDGDNYLFYGNYSVGYSAQIPYNYFTEVVLLPENEDGMVLGTKDGTGQFRVTGGFVLDDEEVTLRDSFNSAVKAVEEKGEYPSSDVGEDSWRIVWREKGERLHIRRFVI